MMAPESVMAHVILLRAVNVGGFNTFRPSLLARELQDYGVVNIGAAGTFVIRKRIGQEKLLTELRGRLPVAAEIIICDGAEILDIAAEPPFTEDLIRPDITRFVSFLSKPLETLPQMPLRLPSEGDWLVKIISYRPGFLFGAYRRHMKTIGYLGQIEKRVGIPVTTRNWNTFGAIVKALNRNVPHFLK